MRLLVLALVVALWPQTGFGLSIGLFADPQGMDCNLVVPYPGGSITAYVVGTDEGAPHGVAGAAFRIGGLPDGWSGVVSEPGADVIVVIGNPFAEGVELAYPESVTGRRVLFTVSITPNSSVQSVSLLPLPHTDATVQQSCGFEGIACSEPCPHFCAFNGWGYDCLCAEPLPSTINGAPCVVGVRHSTWGGLKQIYR